MRVCFSIGIFVSSLVLAACGSQAPHRDLSQNSKGSESLTRDSMPKLMIARVANDSADEESAVVEIRTVDADVKISSHEAAARAFEAGRSLSVDDQVSASLVGNKTAQVDLGAPVQSPVQSSVVTKTTGCVDPCNGQVVQSSKSSTGYIRAQRGGLFYGRGLFGILRPRILCRCGDVGYNQSGVYSSKSYNYSVYQQAPVVQQNMPGQVAVPTQSPVPGKATTGYGPTPVTYYPGGTTSGSTPSTQTTNANTGGRLN